MKIKWQFQIGDSSVFTDELVFSDYSGSAISKALLGRGIELAALSFKEKLEQVANKLEG